MIEPGETVLVPSGIRLALPDGVEAQVRPRSGLSLRTSLRIPNTPGTIDSDFRDEVCIIAENTNPLFFDGSILLREPKLAKQLHQNVLPYNSVITFGKNRRVPSFWCVGPYFVSGSNGHPLGSIYIEAGERIAQMVFLEVLHPEFMKVDSVAEIGENRGGGFGSSGSF